MEGPGLLEKVFGLGQVAFPEDHSPTVGGGHGGAVNPREGEPSGLDRGEVGLGNLVVCLIFPAEGVFDAFGQPHGLFQGGEPAANVLDGHTGDAGGARQFGGGGQDDGVGVVFPNRGDPGQGGFQDVKQIVGPPEKVFD